MNTDVCRICKKALPAFLQVVAYERQEQEAHEECLEKRARRRAESEAGR